MPHLPQARILELVAAFNTLPVGYNTVRGALVSQISPAFVGLLPDGLPPAIQLMSDLGRLNDVVRLSDGSVPLLIWLNNAATLAAGTEAAAIFLRAADDVEHKVSGAPRLVPAQLPEFKELIVHQNDMVSFSFMRAGVEAARAVVKLMVPRCEQGQKILTPDPVIYLGTGWLLTPQLLVTNHHVVNARNENEAPAAPADLLLQGTSTVATFDYDDENQQGTSVSVTAVEAWDATLDYAVLRIPDSGRAPLRLAGAPIQKDANQHVPVNVIQHPRGISKRYAIRNNLVSAITDTDVRYFSDTERGSSGSPVLDDGWRVVALHRGSTYAEGVTFQGRSTAYINLGTKIHAIIGDIKLRYPALAPQLPA